MPGHDGAQRIEIGLELRHVVLESTDFIRGIVEGLGRGGFGAGIGATRRTQKGQTDEQRAQGPHRRNVPRLKSPIESKMMARDDGVEVSFGRAPCRL
jgi:hypothetical protein